MHDLAEVERQDGERAAVCISQSSRSSSTCRIVVFHKSLMDALFFFLAIQTSS